MATNIEPLGIAAEAFGVLVDPGYAAPNLVGHDHQVAAGFDHIVEIEHGKMSAGVDEHLCLSRIVLCDFDAPSPAMHENIDRRVRRLGRVEVNPFDRL